MRAMANTSPVHPLLPKLKELRLGGMLDSLEVRAAQAVADHLSPGEFLALLLDDELERRDQQAAHVEAQGGRMRGGQDIGPLRLRRGAEPQPLRRDGSGHLRLRGQAREPPRLRPDWGGQEPPGQQPGLRGDQEGLPGRYQADQPLLAEIHASRADGSYTRKMARLDLVDLLVLDDFGLRPLSAQGVDDLYEIISRRYERRSMSITAQPCPGGVGRALRQRPPGQCRPGSADPPSQILVIRGRSYRQLGRRKEVEDRGKETTDRWNGRPAESLPD